MVFRNDWVYFSVLRVSLVYCSSFCYTIEIFDNLPTKKLTVFSLTCGIIALFSFGLVRVEVLVFVIIPIAALSEMVNPTLKAFLSNEISERTGFAPRNFKQYSGTNFCNWSDLNELYL
ncbi:MAG: hypothetical protein CM15mP98_00180 [Paracoccaceae bacterium]|nr:MAG: hypothetical protein CM15mP98_00180 [Paracoccaceae bacterium]